MMNIAVYYILPFVIVLGVLIFFHELGHFLLAKAFGVKVETFSLGFGPKLIKKKWGETEYAISLLPLGGYVKMLGEDPEEQEIDPGEIHRSFMHQKITKRIAIVAAGPIFNLLIALPLFFVSNLVMGARIMTPEVGGTTPDSPAERAGLRKGDVILEIDGKKVDTWDDVRKLIADSRDETIRIVIKREGATIPLEVKPEVRKVKNLFGEEKEQKMIGIVSAQKFTTMEIGLWDAFKDSFQKTWEIIYLTIYTLIKLIERVLPLSSIGGPLMIGQMTGQIAQENWGYLLPFMAIISINLAILNLLPFPVLDGGMILMFLLEAIIRRPLSLKSKEIIQKVGIGFLILIMILVTWNDLMRIHSIRSLFEKLIGIFGNS